MQTSKKCWSDCTLVCNVALKQQTNKPHKINRNTELGTESLFLFFNEVMVFDTITKKKRNLEVLRSIWEYSYPL